MQGVLLPTSAGRSRHANTYECKGRSLSGEWEGQVYTHPFCSAISEGQPGLGIVPRRHQKILDDWSLFEGAEKVHEI